MEKKKQMIKALMVYVCHILCCRSAIPYTTSQKLMQESTPQAHNDDVMPHPLPTPMPAILSANKDSLFFARYTPTPSRASTEELEADDVDMSDSTSNSGTTRSMSPGPDESDLVECSSEMYVIAEFMEESDKLLFLDMKRRFVEGDVHGCYVWTGGGLVKAHYQLLCFQLGLTMINMSKTKKRGPLKEDFIQALDAYGTSVSVPPRPDGCPTKHTRTAEYRMDKF